MGHLLGEQIHVLHGEDRDLEAGHATHLARPESPGVHEVLAVDHPEIDIVSGVVHMQMPTAVGSARDGVHPGVPVDLRSTLPGAVGVGVGDTGRIDVTLVLVVHRPDEVRRIEEGHELMGLRRGDELGLHPEIATTGMSHAQVVHALGSVGQLQATGHVDPAVATRLGLDLVVELDGVALQGGDVRIAVEGVHTAGRVPSGPVGQLAALHHHHVGPAGECEVVEHRGAHHSPANHDDLCLCLHVAPPERRAGRTGGVQKSVATPPSATLRSTNSRSSARIASSRPGSVCAAMSSRASAFARERASGEPASCHDSQLRQSLTIGDRNSVV